jgi:prephenate dehydratase
MSDSGAGRKLRVAFQGERGAFSEEAIVALLGEGVDLVARTTFEDLFSAIRDGAADLALAPLENSLAGSVHQSYDLLLESDYHIVDEVTIPIAHYLIGVPGATLDGIRVVQSHPVALAQCLGFFAKHPRIQRVASTDTAGSVREIMEKRDPTAAAIAARRATAVYGGEILLEHLEDHRENYTRFALLSPDPIVAEGANKLSLIVRVKHVSGALHSALGAFATRGVNLMKIDSRPIKGMPWNYSFYLDLEGSTSDPRVIEAFEELRHNGHEYRVLGCYPVARSGTAAVAATRAGSPLEK